MTILCDVDGVVADMLPAWLRLYNREYEDTLAVEDITTWELEPHVAPECGSKIYRYLNDPALYRHTHAVTAAPWGVKQLVRLGHEVIFLSHCTGPEMMAAKYQWLKAWGFTDLGKTILIDSMNLKESIRGDVMVDDYPKNLLGFAGTRILFDAPYNRQADLAGRMTRVAGWPDIVRLLSTKEDRSQD